MKNISFIIAISCLFGNISANEKIRNSIQKLNWNGVEVIYLEDNRFPTYDMVMYFADGALSDGNYPGLTQHALNLIDSGTPTLSQKDILDQIDFLGTELSFDVTHEYSTLSMSGLSKDFSTALTQNCKVFREANYPQDVVRSELDKERSNLKSMVSHPQALAERINREVTMSGTPYSYPVSGKLKDFDKFTPELLKQKSEYFFDKVKKRIYLTGPKSILSIEKVFKDVCQFKGTDSDFVRKISYDKKIMKKSNLVFVPLPDANQVQLRIGRFLNFDEIGDRTLSTLTSDLIGGGFTSRLMREVRVKRGLTYSIGAYISSQKAYGRAGISTFTKNETINKLVEVIDNTVTSVNKGISEDEMSRTVTGLVGSHPFSFESNKAFLSQLLFLDHAERSYDELFNFTDNVKKYDRKTVEKQVNKVFSMKTQNILIIGDKKLEKEVKKLSKKYGKLNVIDYKQFI